MSVHFYLMQVADGDEVPGQALQILELGRGAIFNLLIEGSFIFAV
jgi:hypothetical protein